MLKSIAVVLGSYVLSIVLVFASNPLLSRMFPNDFAPGRVPSDAALIASTVLFAIVAMICSWLCARFAPGNPVRHVFSFFVLGEAMGIIFTVANWSKGWPHWYFLSWLLVWPLSCYVGMLLGRRRAPQLSGSLG